MDIGELFDDTSKVKRQREKKAWQADYVINHVFGMSTRSYVLREMDSHFSIKSCPLSV